MTDEQRLILKMAAVLLDYPARPVFKESLSEWVAWTKELDERLDTLVLAMREIDPRMLAKLYVATFDFDAKRSLYMTAHELGDSRDRGQALIELTQLYRKFGCEVPNDQLPDFLPLLLEWVAIFPLASPPSLLERISRVCRLIAERLEPEHLYRPLFDIVVDALGVAASEFPMMVEEHPDLVDLPYPIQ